MKQILKIFSIRFFIVISLVIVYSSVIISTDIFLKQEVSQIHSEFQSTSYQSFEILFSECNDDLEGTYFSALFSFQMFNRKESTLLALPRDVIHFHKIPFQLLSIPPPTFL